MMDAQENPLEGENLELTQAVNEPAETATNAEPQPEEANQESQPAAEVPQEETPAEEEKPQESPTTKLYASAKDVLEHLRQIAHSDETPDKNEIDHLKSAFYKLHNEERDAHQKAYIEAGGDPDTYQFGPDEIDEGFKAEMGIIREKRAKYLEHQEEEKQKNLQRKQEIIDRIKDMSTSPDMANRSYNEFKKLQQEWKEIKNIPPEKANELWKNYQLYVEQFYDQLNLNREAREYDFKKNLEIKQQLCESAEKLSEEADIVSAFRKLQELHQEYRETGPVAKDVREEVWQRFKAASTIINKKHQQHFEELRSKEKENLEKKTTLCEKAEEIAQQENKTVADWDKHTHQLIDLQAQWKTIGFASKKANTKIFERFRTACDDFFGRKAEFFKHIKGELSDNVAKKKALIAQAQELKDSTDWKSTSDKFIHLQKEWKAIGPVPRKMSNRLWNEFIAACNHFFEARGAANPGMGGSESQNLKHKKDILSKLKSLLEEAGENIQETVQDLADEFSQAGHVPFKEKDKVYDEFHELLDKLSEKYQISVVKQRIDGFKNAIKGMAKRGNEVLEGERGKLMRRYEQLKSEINTYENNLGFLNASSKNGSSLVDEMNKKVQKLKDTLALVREKIKAIDEEDKEETPEA